MIASNPSRATAKPVDSAPAALAFYPGVFSPLNLAAYAIIGLIALNLLGNPDYADDRFLLSLTLIIFLAAFIGREILETRAPAWPLIMLAVQAMAAMINLTLAFDGLNAILLVLIAAQLPGFVPLPVTITVLLLLNAGFYFLLSEWHAQTRPLFTVAVYATFQAFAMLTVYFAHRAEITNRELTAVNAHLLATRSLLEEGVRDGERLRLSRELHDVAGHTLTALKLHLELAQRLPDETQRQARLETAQSLVESLLQDIGGVVSQLRRYDGVDLPAALTTLCRGFPGVNVRLNMESNLRVADVERAETLLRGVQEALTNAVRHGRARHIDVQLRRQGDNIRLAVGDDGRGASDLRYGNGLTGMRERLEQHGGSLHIDSVAGHGLRLSAELPDPP